MNCTGADLIIHLLELQGVRLVAGIPGGTLLPLYDSLGRSRSIRHILARHEQAAGFIAQGMARVTGKAGVCFVISGPGVTNILTALADAKLDSIPLVCIAGQVPTHLIGTDAFQEVATVDIARPITKATFFVRHAQELVQILPTAFRIAESGRPGPVLIDIPKDVQQQRVNISNLDTAATLPSPTRASNAVPYQQAAQMIATAERPLLYVGGGVVKSHAESLLRTFAERASIPVTTTLMALGALPSDHALNIGMLGMHAARFTNLLIDECDLLIVIGARFDDRATGRPDRFAPHARVIHIDIDARELGKLRQPVLAIEDDAHRALHALLQHANTRVNASWIARVAQLRNAHPLHTPHVEEICSPYGIVREVAAIVAHDCVITTDVGQHQMWVAQSYPFQRADRWLTSGGLGTMGFGLPAAIGAALAVPDTPVICFTGDGSLLMNIQELATLAELDLNVKIVLLDNGSLGLVHQQQALFYEQHFVASRYAQPSRFVAIAQAFGIDAVDLGAVAHPRLALKDALQTRGPTLIRVPIAFDQHVLPMVAPGGANIDAVDFALLKNRELTVP